MLRVFTFDGQVAILGPLYRISTQNDVEIIFSPTGELYMELTPYGSGVGGVDAPLLVDRSQQEERLSISNQSHAREVYENTEIRGCCGQIN